MKTMKWSDEAWKAAEEVFESIKELRFVRELADGTLTMRKFRFYINQDRLYLDTYTRVLAHIASRMPENDDLAEFLRFSTDGVSVEKTLHAGYSDGTCDRMTMGCTFYTAYLKSMCEAPLALEAAAILPCFWVYQKIGEYILSIADMRDNPYSDWIATYGSESFDSDTRRAIDICDRLAEKETDGLREKMTRVFVDCTKLERLFWDNAYKEEYF